MVKYNKEDLKTVKLISGRSHQELAQGIARQLGMDLTKINISDFGDGNINVQIRENVRDSDVFVIQTSAHDDIHSVNDFLVEMILIMDACFRSGVKTVTIIVPSYFHARSDKKDIPRVPIGASCVMKLLEAYDFKQIVSMDLHANQIQGFTNRRFDNLYARKMHVRNLKSNIFQGMSTGEINSKFILGSPDNGGAKRVEAYAMNLGMDYLIMHKQRDYSKVSLVMKSIIVGDEHAFRGKTVIMIDDIVDSMGTMVSAAEELTTHGAGNVIVIATHGIFSGKAFERIAECDSIIKVIVTNTLPQKENLEKCPKLQVLDTSEIFAETVVRLCTGGSLTELFL